MDLNAPNTRSLLPSWLRDDPTDQTMAEAVDKLAAKVYQDSRPLTIWDKIDELPEGVLDELAWALSIDWYDYDADIEIKRRLIKDSDFIHSKRGTVAAVEKLVTDQFGDAFVMEWFEYLGNPHNFKIFCTNPALVNDNLTKFLEQLRHVKRHSSKLEAICILLTGFEYMYTGMAVREASFEISGAGLDGMYAFAGGGIMDTTTLVYTTKGGE